MSFKLKLVCYILIAGILLFVGVGAYNNHLESKYPWHIYQNSSFKLLRNNTDKDIVIAYLDTGISDDLYESLGDRIVSPYNVLKMNEDVTDLNGHGTEVACVMACNFEKNGVYGLSNNSKIMPIVVMDETGSTTGENISKGIIYAVDSGADIVNLSLGSRLENDIVKEAVDYAYENNVILIASVGDFRENKVLFPAYYDTVIAVQAQSKLGVRYKDASWGDEVDIRVPGEFVQTLGVNPEDNSLEIKYQSGSSISTAYFTSVIAHIMGQDKSISVDDLLEYVRSVDINDEFLNLYKYVRGYQ